MVEPVQAQIVHTDGALQSAYASIQNYGTGAGVMGRDRMQANFVNTNPLVLQVPELDALHRTSPFCQKVVETYPHDGTDDWINVTLGKDSPAELPSEIMEYLKELQLRELFRDASLLGRLHGDAFIIIGANDGRGYDEPLDESNLQEISFLSLRHRLQLRPDVAWGVYQNPTYYQLNISYGNEALPDQQSAKIHSSRVLRFPGKKLYGDNLWRNSGYNDSVIQVCYNEFTNWLTGQRAGAGMLQSHSMFKYKLKGMAEDVRSGRADRIINRFRMILMGMDALGGLAMDADNEEAEFIQRNYAGVKDLLEALRDGLTAASDMPHYKIWGTPGQGGLKESGGSEKFDWAQRVSTWQNRTLLSPLERVLRLVFLSRQGPTSGRVPGSSQVVFKSTLKLTDKERVELRKLQAEVDKIYAVDIPGVLEPEEIRVSAWGGPEYSIERTIEIEDGEDAEEETEEAKPPLQGQQITSLLEIVRSVESGEIPRDSGIGIITLTYNLEPERAEEILGSAGLNPEPEPEPVPAIPGAVPPQLQPGQTEQPTVNPQSISEEPEDDEEPEHPESLQAGIKGDDATPAKKILEWHGFKLGLQYLPFDKRHGKILPVAYGHIRRTRGADGMALDCYVSPQGLESQRVFAVTQLINGLFDELKIMLGFWTAQDAETCYRSIMPPEMFGGIQQLSLADLRRYSVDFEVAADSMDAGTLDSSVNINAEGKLQIVGEILSEAEYGRLAAVDQQTIEAAITDWKERAPDRFSNLLEANGERPESIQNSSGITEAPKSTGTGAAETGAE